MRRPWLYPLTPLYGAGLWLKGLSPARPRELRGAVVSVGSLSAGGAGKTPVVMLVAKMLEDAGYRVDVLSRGYRRSGRGVERVDPAGAASRFGDEPLMLAQRLGVPVWVGASRFAAGTAAEAGGSEGLVHVLDDGFQHRKLARNVDVVLLTRHDVEDRLLPAGDLREGLKALRRADIVVLREDEVGRMGGVVPAGKVVWVVRRELAVEGEVPLRPVVFCGLARPEGFTGMLLGAGVKGRKVVRFADHHAYRERDITRLLRVARAAGADGFVTTEKDAVKLSGEMLRRLEAVGPVCVVELRMELVTGSAADLTGLL